MKYLKTYKVINESNLSDLSFDDFQDILFDITDKYKMVFIQKRLEKNVT